MQDFRMETFLAVCREMNFTKAAERLHITQPAVSQHIRVIEEYYGAKLFAFHGKRMSLTRAGELLCRAALTMKHDQIYLKEEIEALDKEEHAVNFGVTLTIAEFVMPRYLIPYQRRHPNIRIRMEVANTQRLLEKITSGEIDFALVEGYFDKSGYDWRVYARERYIPVCAPQTLPAGRYPFRELLSQRLLVREEGSGTREILEKYLRQQNMELREFAAVTELGSIPVIKEMAKAGLGITFLYETAVRRELAEGTLMEIGTEDFQMFHDFTFLWRKGSIFKSHYQEIFSEFKGTKGEP